MEHFKVLANDWQSPIDVKGYENLFKTIKAWLGEDIELCPKHSTVKGLIENIGVCKLQVKRKHLRITLVKNEPKIQKNVVKDKKPTKSKKVKK